jgi:hypothetical protein
MNDAVGFPIVHYRGFESQLGAAQKKLAERVGFEPTVGLRLRLISSQVHSTTLPPLRPGRMVPERVANCAGTASRKAVSVT